MTKERPDFVLEEHLDYLDALRYSGEVNMWGARIYLMEEYPDLTKTQAGEILHY